MLEIELNNGKRINETDFLLNASFWAFLNALNKIQPDGTCLVFTKKLAEMCDVSVETMAEYIDKVNLYLSLMYESLIRKSEVMVYGTFISIDFYPEIIPTLVKHK